MRIAIIVPKSANPKAVYKEYPLGAGYIATILKNNGHIIKLYDQNIEFYDNNALVDELIKFSPSIIGFSILTSCYPTSQDIIKLLNVKNFKPILIAGGIHPTIFPHDCINDGFDIVIKGEGEEAIIKIVDVINDGSDFSNINNIVFKKNNKIIETEGRSQFFVGK